MHHAQKLLLGLMLTSMLAACEEAPAEKKPAPAAPSAAAAPVAAAPAPAPTPSAEPEKLREDCPKGSSGVGTLDKPCVATDDSRMMEVKYTGKMEDQGPKFSVVNKANSPILFGSLVAYFYDKAGKQLQVTAGDKTRPYQTCTGNIFAGAVKPSEKIFMFFSCVKKVHVPEGTVTIEAEVKTVGFADADGRKNEFYWQNPNLVPDARPKGGAAKTKK